jgi:hypothetical protein
MAISVTDAGSRITANAANVATQMGGGTTTAEATAIGALLTALSSRQDLMNHIIKLANTTDATPA